MPVEKNVNLSLRFVVVLVVIVFVVVTVAGIDGYHIGYYEGKADFECFRDCGATFDGENVTIEHSFDSLVIDEKNFTITWGIVND